MNGFEYFFTGLLLISSILFLWFKTELPVHIFHIVDKKLRDVFVTRDDWEAWINTSAMSKWDLFWAELLTCRGCLSVHISWAVALPWAMMAYPPWLWIFALIGAGPVVSNILAKNA